jgi:5'-3' exonuclease
MAYEEKLFEQGGVKAILTHPHLEADDCIALSVKFLLNKYPKVNINIITSDKDYLQLVEERVKIFDLSFKNISEKKSSFGCKKTDLFCKIVMGDISDNITSVLKKCGPKTALKCYNDQNYFDERMKKENAYEKFEQNKKIIDFDCIPEELVAQFIEGICKPQ